MRPLAFVTTKFFVRWKRWNTDRSAKPEMSRRSSADNWIFRSVMVPSTRRSKPSPSLPIQIHAGDIVFLWETGDDWGIRAIFTVGSEPQDMP
jgi:hypothetical protein